MMLNAQKLMDAIEAHADKVRETEAKRIDACACGTDSDYRRHRQAQKAEEASREALEALVASLVTS